MPLTVQTAVELEVTETVPSPVVSTVAVNPPMVAFDGRLEMVGVLGTARSTAKVWGFPSAAA